jgi:hypothetical protein
MDTNRNFATTECGFRYVVLINGRACDRVKIKVGSNLEEIGNIAMSSPRVKEYLGSEVVREVIISSKTINLIVR